jgi:hypothetical protein
MPTFRNTLFRFHRQVGVKKFLETYLPMKMEQNVPKRRRIKFRRREITQKKAYNSQFFVTVIFCDNVPGRYVDQIPIILQAFRFHQLLEAKVGVMPSIWHELQNSHLYAIHVRVFSLCVVV